MDLGCADRAIAPGGHHAAGATGRGIRHGPARLRQDQSGTGAAPGPARPAHADQRRRLQGGAPGLLRPAARGAAYGRGPDPGGLPGLAGDGRSGGTGTARGRDHRGRPRQPGRLRGKRDGLPAGGLPGGTGGAGRTGGRLPAGHREALRRRQPAGRSRPVHHRLGARPAPRRARRLGCRGRAGTGGRLRHGVGARRHRPLPQRPHPSRLLVAAESRGRRAARRADPPLQLPGGGTFLGPPAPPAHRAPALPPRPGADFPPGASADARPPPAAETDRPHARGRPPNPPGQAAPKPSSTVPSASAP